MARGKTEGAKSKVSTATALAGLGAGIGAVGGPVGSAIGGGLGAITGLIIGDDTTVFPMDMIAIPAYQAYLLSQAPAFTIYIKEGEVLTQVMPTDAEVAEEIIEKPTESKKPRRKTPRERKYAAAFKRIQSNYKKKDGTWKKGGFKACVKAAHAIAGGKK